jgi:hypothetical protein
MEIIEKSILYLIPSILESSLRIYDNYGNMGKYGLYLGLYYRRNILYISVLTTLTNSLFNNYISNIVIMNLNFFSVLNYSYYVYLWNNYL